MPLVTIRIQSDDSVPSPVENVLVHIYSTSSFFITSGVTSNSGVVQFLLPDNFYDVFCYKQGLSIIPKQPQRIEVTSSLTNDFTIYGHIKQTVESIDPNKCTVSGYILGASGSGSKYRLVFSPVKTLLVNNRNIIGPHSRIEYVSDEFGYFEFELLRNTEYNAYFVYPEDFLGQPGRLSVITPNLPSVALHSLLFPIPINLNFSSNAISLPAGGEWDSSIDAELTFSDGSIRNSLSTPWAGVTISNTNNLIVDAAIRESKLYLKPLTAGTATITTMRSIPSTVLYTPLPTYISESVIVTVL